MNNVKSLCKDEFTPSTLLKEKYIKIGLIRHRIETFWPISKKKTKVNVCFDCGVLNHFDKSKKCKEPKCFVCSKRDHFSKKFSDKNNRDSLLFLSKASLLERPLCVQTAMVIIWPLTQVVLTSKKHLKKCTSNRINSHMNCKKSSSLR